jgi:hypothetical protein
MNTDKKERQTRIAEKFGVFSLFLYICVHLCSSVANLFGLALSRHTRQIVRFFSNCMLSASPRISLVNTSKLAGVPASRVFSPLTIDS